MSIKRQLTRALKEVQFRKISGIILIDFINLEQKENRKSIEELLEKRTNKGTYRFKWSAGQKLGLMELTAKRTSESFMIFSKSRIRQFNIQKNFGPSVWKMSCWPIRVKE